MDSNQGSSLTRRVLGENGGYFQNFSYGSKTSDMTSEGLWEMFEGDFADTCAETILLIQNKINLVMYFVELSNTSCCLYF